MTYNGRVMRPISGTLFVALLGISAAHAQDPPHVAPIDGKEYADKRGVREVNAKLAGNGSAAPARDAKVAKSPQAIL